jgi:hypothetical protein
MQVAARIHADHAAQQTFSVVGVLKATALLGVLCQLPTALGARDAEHGNGDTKMSGGLIHLSYGGIASSNSSVHVSASSSVDQPLAAELTRVFVHLASNQKELDGDAKRALYGNLPRLYRR